MSPIRRVATGLALCAALLVSSGCTASTAPDPPSGPIEPIVAGAPHDPTTITVWSFNRLPNEVAAFRSALDRLEAAYPWLTVEFVENKDDAAFAQAVAGGNPPDVFISGAPDNVAKFCHNGTVSDLGPYLSAAGVDVAATFPAATLVYTQYQGKQCALPLLTDVYSLFYNKLIFAEAGITAPPRTLSELTEVAKKLTVFNPDGTVARFGFVPRSDYSGNGYLYAGVVSGTQFYGPDGKATLGSDPRWAELLRWSKELTDFYGPGQVDNFVATYQSHTDDAENPLLTGKVAMEFDGEWHIGENAEFNPGLDYGIAPMPLLDSEVANYGAGPALGTVAYLPAGSQHQREAAFAIQQLTTDTQFLHTLADTVFNVPTTFESLRTWDKNTDEHWKPVIDIFAHPGSYYRGLTPAGAEDFDVFAKFIQSYELGQVPDLDAGLDGVAADIDALNARSGS